MCWYENSNSDLGTMDYSPRMQTTGVIIHYPHVDGKSGVDS